MEIFGRGGGENLDSQNLRDFLRIKEEENQSTSSSSGGGGLTLFAVLSDKRPPPPPLEEPLQRVNSNRTLLDIIREDQISGLGGGGGRRDARRSWRHLKDKIRLRRRGNDDVWSSSVTIPSSDVPLSSNSNNRHRMLMMSRRPSTRFNSDLDSSESTQPSLRANYRSASGRYEHLSSSPRRRLVLEEEEDRGGDTADEVAAARGGAAEQPARMSLMALLEETDRQMGLERSTFVMVEDEEEVDEVDSVGAAVNGGVGFNDCCVCMVRHKGAAFIPCGHTFCRLCSRELWVQRGHCPLCNNYILEILDIF